MDTLLKKDKKGSQNQVEERGLKKKREKTQFEKNGETRKSEM